MRNRFVGGNRYITCMDSEPLTLQQIQDRAWKLFCPKVKSHFGLLQDMPRVVTNSAEQVIHSFPGCGMIADYLTENGLYLSLTYLYLRTICVTSDKGEQQTIVTQTRVMKTITWVILHLPHHSQMRFYCQVQVSSINYKFPSINHKFPFIKFPS